MPSRAATECPHREAVEALAHDALPDDQRPHAQQHLEYCERCRPFFREQTSAWFPTLENYTVVEKIGEGGFGVVYKAVHHAKQRTEALKILFGRTPLRTAYFENEVHLIARLRHPNIATLYDAQLKRPPLYYTMEFVEGERLDHYLKSHKVSLAERIRIIKTVAEAVGYAHSEGVVHRDIKPQNILIDAADQPRIVDFGIAKKLALAEQESGDGEPSPGSPEGAVGTLGYVAPEQTAGRPVDARADVFSLGVLLFHCVTGEAARWAADTTLLGKVLHERQISRAEDLAAIIHRAVEVDPQRRYCTCAAFVQDLENYLEGRAVQAHEGRSVAYQAARVAAYESLHHPYLVRGIFVGCAAVLLMSLTWLLGARWFTPGTADGRTVLISFNQATRQALADGRIGADLPGLSLFNGKSWRLLHGRLMERLAQAKPLVVVWDYYFPDPQPDFDDAFVRGIQAVDAPVLVGCRDFDVNGQPQMCPRIRDAVDGYGAMPSVRPETYTGEFEFVGCFQRGFERPIPGLAVAGFAAARFPDCRVDLEIKPPDLHLRYRKRRPDPGQPRWQRETDKIPIHTVAKLDSPRPGLLAGDQPVHLRVPIQPLEEWDARTTAYEDVLIADPKQLRQWFEGRVVVVGQMFPGEDQHLTESGEKPFGCQLQAQALDALFSHTHLRRLTRVGLVVRVCLWCAAVAILAGIWKPRPRRSLRAVTVVCTAVCALGVAIAVYAAAWVTEPVLVEIAIGTSCVLSAGSLALLANAIRQRQLQLAPEAFPVAPDGTTLDSTVLADTG
ncbi:MAG TPA: protein kinase [Phycisphaerae bacterium]|nr:protein kinase [Phycisphaerae bacterium]